MVIEEMTQECTSPSGYGSFGRSSNSKKTKKVPQRGLGVAQLEKIRLEEQHNKDDDASVLMSSPTKSSSSTCVPPNQICHIRHYQPPSSIPFSCNVAAEFVRKQNSDVALPNGNVFERNGYTNVVVRGMWNVNSEYNGNGDLNKESQSGMLDPGFAFLPSLNDLPSFDHSNPIWPLPNFRSTTHPPAPAPAAPPFPSLVNLSSASSMSTSSSVLNFHTEPPSNQSFYGNYTIAPMWPDEEKHMVGMKRSYPFSHDTNAASIDLKFPTFVASLMRTDETTTCGNRRGTYNSGHGSNSIFSEGPTCATSIADSNAKFTIKENVTVNGDFLKLAPPTSNRTCRNQKFIFPPGYLAFPNPEVPDFASLPYQGSSEDTILPRRPVGSIPQQVFYNFIPPAKAQIIRPAATIKTCNGDVGEAVDLNLKL